MFGGNRMGLAVACSLAIAAPLASSAAAQGVASEREVLQADAARIDALLNADAAGLERLLANDLVYVAASGRIEDKRSIVFAAKSKSRTYERYIATEQTPRINGNIAIVTGVAAMRGMAGKEPFDTAARYTAIYVRREARWQLTVYHETPIAPLNRIIGGESA